MNDIKIYVSHRIDNEAQIIKDDIYTPIRCGAIFDDRSNIDMLGDNTGDNISEKRMTFCELTVLYWAWKNQKADYYGLCHYRRYLSAKKDFLNISKDEHSAGCINIDYLTNKNIENYKFSSSDIRKEIEGYDAVFMKPIDLYAHNLKSNYESMEKATKWHNMEWIDKAIKIAKKKYPEMSDVIDTYLYKYRYSYLYNCFVMKKDFFDQFCNWLFSILFELEQQIDISNCTQQMSRVFGTTGEHFFGIWVLWMIKQHCKINELPLLFVEHPEPQEKIQPAFDQNNIVIACSSSKEYAPYLSVWLKSILDHTSEDYNYDIIVFEKDISQKDKSKLLKMVKQKNCSLRFLNPLPLINNINIKIPKNYALECCFRILSPILLENFSKVIFTDIDLLIQDDLKYLYQEDISDFPLCACHDLVYGAFLNYPNNNWAEYCKDVLKLEKPYEYYNTGVMLLNIKEWNEKGHSQDLVKLLSTNEYRILEQDAINLYFKDTIKYIDTKWNHNVESSDFKHINLFSYMPLNNAMKYSKDKENPSILHWAGRLKPWIYPEEEYADIWWEYARKTPFYEEILARLINNRFSANEYNTKLLYILAHITSFKLKKAYYGFKKAFAFGKRHEKYQAKYNNVKALIKDAKKFKKQMFK